MNGAATAPILLAILIVPKVVDLKTVGYNSILIILNVHHDELIANFPNKAKITLIDVGIISKHEITASKRNENVNFFLPKYFNPK